MVCVSGRWPKRPTMTSSAWRPVPGSSIPGGGKEIGPPEGDWGWSCWSCWSLGTSKCNGIPKAIARFRDARDRIWSASQAVQRRGTQVLALRDAHLPVAVCFCTHKVAVHAARSPSSHIASGPLITAGVHVANQWLRMKLPCR